MKKIIPFITNIYFVILYIDQNNKPSIAYSANTKFFNKERPKQKFEDMAKLHFADIDSANLYLATKIYPNIDGLNGFVENATLRNDEENDKEYALNGWSSGGSGKQFYFAGMKNLDEHYFGFYMAKENLIRRKVLAKQKQIKSK